MIPKYILGDKVRHKLNTFEGRITGVLHRVNGYEYEVLPCTDRDAKWVSAVWIDEHYLEVVNEQDNPW